MKIKKFSGKNYKIVLEMIKTEFGENAVILSTNEKKGGQSYVEITAAIDYDNEFSAKDNTLQLKAPLPDSSFNSLDIGSFYKKDDKKIKNNLSEQDDLGEKGQRDKVSLSACSGLWRDRKEELLDLLNKNSLKGGVKTNNHNRYENSPSGGLQNNNTSEIKIKNCEIVMLIGPTGVGKTTTIAKLSAAALKEGKRVGLISLDNYRIGALEQIRIYARIMGIPLYPVSCPDDLKEGIPRFMKNRDLIFIDTMGRHPGDRAYIKLLSESCMIGLPMEVHLLISASSDYEFMLETYKSYNELPVKYIALTKFDEAVRVDNLHSLLDICRKPLAYITTGQKVPDHIEFASYGFASNSFSNKGMSVC